jgi:hypothetical protein
VIGQEGDTKMMVEVTWSGIMRHMLGDERKRCDNGKGTGARGM